MSTSDVIGTWAKRHLDEHTSPEPTHAWAIRPVTSDSLDESPGTHARLGDTLEITYAWYNARHAHR